MKRFLSIALASALLPSGALACAQDLSRFSTWLSDDISLADQLNADALDGSIESLDLIDGYLTEVKKGLDDGSITLSDPEFGNAVMGVGGYLGLIMVTSAPVDECLTYPEAVEAAPELQETVGAPSAFTFFLITGPDGSIQLPMTRVMNVVTGVAEGATRDYAEAFIAAKPVVE